MKKIPQDIIGNIALLKFPKRTLWIARKFQARKFLKKNPNITTVLEKSEGFSGELRTLKTKYLAGIKTKEVVYKENNCTFKFNIEKTYFSQRLSNERNIVSEEILKLVKKIKDPKILTMFAGVAPYPIVLAKKLKQNKIKAKIYSNELNKDANKYAEENIKLNKLESYIELIPGDVKKIKIKNKFNIILMTRPNLKDTFLKETMKLTKKGTIIFYHGFGTKDSVTNEIKESAKNKIKNLSLRKAGDIGAYKFRWQAKFTVK